MPDEAQSEDHAGVLNGSVRIQELRADDADLWPLSPANELLEPVALNHLDVVVQEEQQIAARRRCARVAGG